MTSTTTQDNRREWRRRQQMANGPYHPPLYLERAAKGARDALVYVDNPPVSVDVDEAEERLRRGM